MPALFIGITTWNSATFLPYTLRAIRATTSPSSTEVAVLDNLSHDQSAAIALSHGATVLRRRSSQAAALTDLFNMSRAEFTLLVHADVILLNPNWLDLCVSAIDSHVALVSPEDIGCGPYTRPWGSNMPESSFLFFHTKMARRTRRTFWRRRFGLTLPFRGIDFSGDHITYSLPERLREASLSWKRMDVHTSSPVPEPIYMPDFEPTRWYPHLADYEYGLGNFYSIDGTVTHYHNWFERSLTEGDPRACLSESAGGLPIEFLNTYSRAFLRDFDAHRVHVPEQLSRRPEA